MTNENHARLEVGDKLLKPDLPFNKFRVRPVRHDGQDDFKIPSQCLHESSLPITSSRKIPLKVYAKIFKKSQSLRARFKTISAVDHHNLPFHKVCIIACER